MSLSELYQEMYDPGSPANRPTVQPDQSRPWKSSTLSLPKKASIAALSGEWPRLDIERTMPAALQPDPQSGVR